MNLDEKRSTGLDEPRLVAESGLAERLTILIAPVARSLGYRLVRARLTGQNGATLQVMAEREDGSFSIADCENLSRALSPVLDVENPIRSKYYLEVSSPGIDRPLVRASDFSRWLGHEVKIEFVSMIGGRKRVRGFIRVADEKEALIAIEGEEAPFRVSYREMSEAKLVMNDRLLAEAKLRAKTDDVSDGAPFDALKYQDISIKEDRRASHGSR